MNPFPSDATIRVKTIIGTAEFLSSEPLAFLSKKRQQRHGTPAQSEGIGFLMRMRLVQIISMQSAAKHMQKTKFSVTEKLLSQPLLSGKKSQSTSKLFILKPLRKKVILKNVKMQIYLMSIKTFSPKMKMILVLRALPSIILTRAMPNQSNNPSDVCH